MNNFVLNSKNPRSRVHNINFESPSIDNTSQDFEQFERERTHSFILLFILTKKPIIKYYICKIYIVNIIILLYI